MRPRLLLLTSATGPLLERLLALYAGAADVVVVPDAAALAQAPADDATTLLGVGTGVIVPAALLARLGGRAYNLHAASPEYPGRDPHHHAIYRGASTYGATLHVMTASVDAGPIIDVERFPVPQGCSPAALLAMANDAGLRILERQGMAVLGVTPLVPLTDAAWGERKTTRADLQRLSSVSPLITREEFDRRFRAFDGGDYENLTTRLHGRTFRIDKTVGTDPEEADNSRWAEFTETGFRALLKQLVAADYRFARFGDRPREPHVLWRHDVDFSLHRAARLAEIEAEEGAVATYFVNPRSSFYGLLEPESAGLLQRIAACGHDIGLHFDAEAFARPVWTAEALQAAVAQERALAEAILQRPVHAVSWHNPAMSNLLDFDQDEIAGLVNAYGDALRSDYVYASDSNGYWRFAPMRDVIAAGHPRLHLLTHPEWWTPQPLSPSERIDRCLLGRARALRKAYDDLLARGGRKNVE